MKNEWDDLRGDGDKMACDDVPPPLCPVLLLRAPRPRPHPRSLHPPPGSCSPGSVQTGGGRSRCRPLNPLSPVSLHDGKSEYHLRPLCDLSPPASTKKTQNISQNDKKYDYHN